MLRTYWKYGVLGYLAFGEYVARADLGRLLSLLRDEQAKG